MLATESFVIDASVAAKWHLADEDYSDAALLLLDRATDGQCELWAPDHIQVEVPSAITAATVGRVPRLTPTAGQAAIEAFLAIGLRLAASDTLLLRAYSLAHLYG